MPCTGGGSTTIMNASWIAASLPNSAPWMAAAVLLGSPVRDAYGSRMTNMAPAFGALVKVAPEKPTMLTTLPTPGVLRTSSAARFIAVSVRSSDAPGGNWAATIR